MKSLIYLPLVILLTSCASTHNLDIVGRSGLDQVPYYQESVKPVFGDFFNLVKKRTGRKLIHTAMSSNYRVGPLITKMSREEGLLKDRCVVLIAVKGNGWDRVGANSIPEDKFKKLVMFAVAHEAVHCLTFDESPHEIVAKELDIQGLSKEAIIELTSDLIALVYLDKKYGHEASTDMINTLKRIRHYNFAERLYFGSEYNYSEYVSLDNAQLINERLGLLIN